jgi:hypothetical protein
MARYIDADAFLDKFNKALESQQHYGLYNNAKITQYVMKAIENEPTADVVPKSEVALDVIRKVKNKVRKYKHNVVNPYEHIILYLNELEKKYTEEEK